MIATGRPGVATSRPADVVASSSSPSRLTRSTPEGNRDRHLLAAERRDRLDTSRPCPAANPVEQILDRPELRLHGAAAEEVPGHGEDADASRVAGETAAGADLLLRVGVTVVDVERERRLRVGRNVDEHALGRIAAGENETERGLGAQADTERLRAGDVSRLPSASAGFGAAGFGLRGAATALRLRCRRQRHRDDDEESSEGCDPSHARQYIAARGRDSQRRLSRLADAAGFDYLLNVADLTLGVEPLELVARTTA